MYCVQQKRVPQDVAISGKQFHMCPDVAGDFITVDYSLLLLSFYCLKIVWSEATSSYFFFQVNIIKTMADSNNNIQYFSLRNELAS